MAVSVVIQNIEPLPALGATVIRGTVAGVAHLYARVGKPLTIGAATGLNLTPTQLATEFLSDYNLQVAAIALLASVTVSVNTLDGQTSSVVFGATPVSEVGTHNLEILATVAGTSGVKNMMSQKEFLALYQFSLNPNPSISFPYVIAKRMVDQLNLNLNATVTGQNYIATFSI